MHAEQGASPPLPVHPILHMQSIISSLPIADTEFERQAWHISETAPTAVEYFPATQSVHAALLMLLLYFPATHDTHEPPLTPEEPVLQMQSVISSLAITAAEFKGHAWHTSEAAATAVEYFPATQFVHAALPGLLLYFPAAQTTHEPPLTPEEPVLQMQSVISSLAIADIEFK